MRPALRSSLVVLVIAIGVITFAATRGVSCEDAFASTESRLEPAPDRLAEARTRPTPGGGVETLQWVLTTNELELYGRLLDMGSWTAYVNRAEVSRIEADGTIRWTRTMPSRWAEPIGDGRIAATGFVEGRHHVAVLDADGELLHCHQTGPVGGGLTGDGAGGFVVNGDPDREDDDAANDVIRRIEVDGTERWRAELASGPQRFADAMRIEDGLVVIGRKDILDGPILAAFDDASGDLLWAIDGQQPEIGPVRSIAGIIDGQLYVTVESDQPFIPELLAIDATTGAIRWSSPVTVRDNRSTVEPIDDDTVVLRSTAIVTAVDPTTGDVHWTVGENLGTLDLGRDAGVLDVGQRLLHPVAGGRIIDLRTGRWGRLLEEDRNAIFQGFVVDGDTLIVDTKVNPEGGTFMYLSGWTFDPAAATTDTTGAVPTP